LTPEGNLPLSTAFCLPPGMGKPGDESPGIRWSAGPAGTKSYVIISTDPDVVQNLSLMNKPGVTIPADAPRMDIYHWVLIDIPAIQHHIPPGGDGAHFVPGGKPIGQAAYGVRGTNDYWPYFNKRPGAPAAMKGPYGGFDGPCPPKNDLLVHDYKFQVFALDVAKLPLSGQFFAPAVFKAMEGHVLARGEANAKFPVPSK
jgi:Raf kinase inhibitor-like YbhB/YbcL family protein